jgi:hypothetical protein
VVHLLAAAAAGHGSDTPPWAVYAALITAGVGLIGQALIRMKEARDRRRDEYSRAFEAAMAWTEFPYRIARRLSNEGDAVGPIVARMHDAQEQICFHENWMRSVSDDIAKAYSALVDAVKEKSAPHIQTAWKQAPARIPDGMILGEAFPVRVKSEVDAFTKQIRRDLSYLRQLWTWLRPPG